jgi:hypothetical protein
LPVDFEGRGPALLVPPLQLIQTLFAAEVFRPGRLRRADYGFRRARFPTCRPAVVSVRVAQPANGQFVFCEL